MSAAALEQQLPRKGDFRCATCGYGVARARPPERCPMCAGSSWQEHARLHMTADVRLEAPSAVQA